MKARILLTLAVAGLLGGCATSTPDLYTYRDDNISGDVFQMTSDNLLVDNAAPGTEVWLNASRIVQRRGGVVLYHLEARYASADWLQIEAGATLQLTVDGEAVRFDGLGSSAFRKTGKAGEKTEDAIYRCTGADIRKIAEAHEVKVELFGSKGTITRSFGPANFDTFKKFVTKYMDHG